MNTRELGSADHPILFFILGAVGAEPAVSISKDGGAFEAAQGAVSEVGYGWYALAGNASDRDTLGTLIIHIELEDADIEDLSYEIVSPADLLTAEDIDFALSATHGDGLWGPNVGLVAKTYTLLDESGDPVQGVECWATTDAAGLLSVDIHRITNDLGQVVFQFDLPTGTHVWIWYRALTAGDEEVI